MIKRVILSFFIILSLTIYSTVYAEDISGLTEIVVSGNNDVSWGIRDGTLTITGTGPIPNNYTPWVYDGNSYTGTGSSIKRLVVGEGITRIGDYVTQGLSNLQSVSLPSTLKQIGGQNFKGLRDLPEIVFPEGIEEIDYCCFHNCDSLVSVTIPASLTELGWGSFAFCASLENIYVESGQCH